jgi:outer membrane protein assembly factor BamB
MFRKCLVIVLIFFCYIPSGLTQMHQTSGWNQFRGNFRNGTGETTDILTEWPQDGPGLVWKKEIGSGFSELLVSGNRLYTLFAEKTDSVTGWEYVASYDAGTGEELWRSQLDSIFIDVDGWGDGPRSTPASDDAYLYCFSGHGKLYAVSKTDGSILWTVDFVRQFNSTLPRWGFSASPILSGDMVIMEVGGDEGRAFAAFNKQNGGLIWAAGEGDAMYSSPITAEINGQQQIIFVNGRRLSSYDMHGDTLWTYQMPIGNPMASPLFIPPAHIFVSANNGSGSFLIGLDADVINELFTSSAMKNDWSSSVYRDGYIYGFNLASLQCISVEDGKRVWHKRGFGKGNLILVGDKLLVLSDQGDLSVVNATPEGFTELGSISVLEGRSWTAPSYANGRVYMRNHTHMACVELFGE